MRKPGAAGWLDFVTIVVLLVMLGWILAALCGCAAREAQVKAPASSLVIPRECILSVKLTPKTHCVGTDKQHMNCKGIELTIITGCGQLAVAGDNSKKGK